MQPSDAADAVREGGVIQAERGYALSLHHPSPICSSFHASAGQIKAPNVDTVHPEQGFYCTAAERCLKTLCRRLGCGG